MHAFNAVHCVIEMCQCADDAFHAYHALAHTGFFRKQQIVVSCCGRADALYKGVRYFTLKLQVWKDT